MKRVTDGLVVNSDTRSLSSRWTLNTCRLVPSLWFFQANPVCSVSVSTVLTSHRSDAGSSWRRRSRLTKVADSPAQSSGLTPGGSVCFTHVGFAGHRVHSQSSDWLRLLSRGRSRDAGQNQNRLWINTQVNVCVRQLPDATADCPTPTASQRHSYLPFSLSQSSWKTVNMAAGGGLDSDEAPPKYSVKHLSELNVRGIYFGK